MQSHAFLLRVARLLHQYGTPAHRLERVLGLVSQSLGVRAAFFSTPTSVFASFEGADGERVHLLRGEPGETNLGKLVEFDQVLEEVEAQRADLDTAAARLEAIDAAPSRWPASVTMLAHGVACAAAATFFGGGPSELFVAAFVGAAIALLGRRMAQSAAGPGLFEPLAAFLAATIALCVGRLLTPLDDRAATLASLIVLVPGFTLTVGLIELATRHLASGTARIAGAAMTVLALLLGVALAWGLGERLLPAAGFTLLAPGFGVTALAGPLPAGAEWAAMLVAPLAFAVILEARRAELPVILATGIAGYVSFRGGSAFLGPELAPFVGALAVGLASNLYARAVDRPSLVPMTPGILLLVPGSIGYRSLTDFLEADSLSGIEGAFRTGLVAVSLVGGLLAANVVLPPRRVL